MKSLLKKSIPHIIAVTIFVALVCIYFSPSIFEGKTLQQGDSIQVSGMTKELDDYWKGENGSSAWTNSMFSGMPSYHIFVHGNPPNFLGYLQQIIWKLDYFGGSIILTALLCFYILMCVIGIKRWLAIAGSIAFAFASFNLISIMAGHVTKTYVMALMPLALAGIFLLFKRKWLWGSILFTLGVCFSIMNSHLQITYYLALLCIVLAIGFLFIELRKKEYSDLVKVACIAIVCVIVAILPNMGNLYANYESAQESLRGPSELTPATDNATAEKKSDGLDIKYAFTWSYGKEELMTLLIPKAYGGSSHETLGKDSQFYKTYRSLGMQVKDDIQAPTYWGDQPFTGGPVYFGAIVCFLFVLGMFVVKNPIKWWLAGGALLFIMLSLGRNLSWFNDFLFHHLPMYNKFRTPSMSLVIPGMIFPLIGFWGLKEIFAEKTDKKALKKALIWAVSLTGGICFLVWIIPDLFLSFQSVMDERYQQWPPQLMEALIADRKSLASADAGRSLLFILLTGGLLFYFLYAKNKAKAATFIGISLTVLVLADLWPVAKNYLNEKSFEKRKLHENFQRSTADDLIFRDISPSYRVVNLMGDTFQDSSTSFFHKSIGGYHAAKLGRYQELIDHYLAEEINRLRSAFQTINSIEEIYQNIQPMLRETPVLNMLNAKYFIFSPDHPPLVNPYAYGNAWFVKDLKMVENADQEMAVLGSTPLQETAIVDQRFEAMIGKTNPDTIQSASIQLISCKPNLLVYESNAEKDETAVFSEVYYPHGWKAFIDGNPVDIFRADWILRAIPVPAGKHTIEFRFEPDTYNTLNKIGSILSLLLLLALVGAVVYSTKKTTKSFK